MMKKGRDLTQLRRLAWPGALVLTLALAGLVTLGLGGVDISRLVAAATSSITPPPASLYLEPQGGVNMPLGSSKELEVVVDARVPINAIGTTISFSPDDVEILGFSKERSFFDLWTEETAIREDAGEIHFSGGTVRSGGLVGTGTVLTLTVRAKRAGNHNLVFKAYEIYSGDGTGLTVEADAPTLTLTVPEAPRVFATNYVSPILSVAAPAHHIADLDEDGKINLVDISIMLIRFTMPYEARFDLDKDSTIGLADLSVVLSHVQM